MRRILPGKIVSLGMQSTLAIKSRVDICPGVRHRAGDVLKQLGASANVLIVTQKSMPDTWCSAVCESLVDQGFRTITHHASEGEDCKSPAELAAIWQILQSHNFERNDTIFAVGGGAITDIAGFAASTYLRGLRYVSLPGTLLAQVDASIGGKNAINLGTAKNLAGTVYMPDAVLIDTEVLSTLPARELQSGMGEIVKYAYIEKTVADNTEYSGGPRPLLDVIDANFADGLNPDDPSLPAIITACIRMKLAVVAADPLERGLRRCLNLGHTLAHALEKASRYQITHGEAVAIGTIFALELSCKLNRMDTQEIERARRILQALNLPVRAPEGLPDADLLSAIQQDKKRADGTIKFVLPEKSAGYVNLDEKFSVEDICARIKEFCQLKQ